MKKSQLIEKRYISALRTRNNRKSLKRILNIILAFKINKYDKQIHITSEEHSNIKTGCRQNKSLEFLDFFKLLKLKGLKKKD